MFLSCVYNFKIFSRWLYQSKTFDSDPSSTPILLLYSFSYGLFGVYFRRFAHILARFNLYLKNSPRTSRPTVTVTLAYEFKHRAQFSGYAVHPGNQTFIIGNNSAT